jgi:cell division protein ZapA
MARAGVELTVGGQSYRVVATSEEGTLQRYAAVVNARLRELTGSEHPSHPQALLLVAIALAHDLEREKERRLQVQEQAGEMLRSLLVRIDAALDSGDDDPAPSPAPPPS